jgi:isoquinoline 1-oxidoreductase subunit beta
LIDTIRGIRVWPQHRTRLPCSEGNFDGYQVLTIDEMPLVDVHIVQSGKTPTGVGEPGVPPIGPAVANAIYAATKKRIRILPFSRPENA